MRYESSGHNSRRSRELEEALGGWARLDTEQIYREMIAEELRTGRLTPARQTGIVRFGSHLGLSVLEASKLVAECRDRALQSSDPTERNYALRLLQPSRIWIPSGWKIAGVIAAAIVFDIIIVKWLF